MDETNDNGAIQVEIDSELEPIIPDFFEIRRKDYELLGHLLEDGNFVEISRLGHRLRGAGGSYGFDLISDIGLALEEAAASQDRDTVAANREKLLQYLEHVIITYV